MVGNQPIQRTRDNLQKSVRDKARMASNEIKRNPINTIEKRYNDLRGLRQPFIDEAQEMAEMVVPGMYDGTPTEPCASGKYLFGQSQFNSPNQSLVAKGCLYLSWTMAAVMLPSDGDYFSRHVELSYARTLEMIEAERKRANANAPMGQTDPNDFIPIPQQFANEYLQDDMIVRQQTASSNHQEVLARCMYHSIIGGISVFGHLSLDKAKAYTIQNSVTVFDSSHEPVECIVVDRLPLSSLPDGVRKQLVGSITLDDLSLLYPHDESVTVYTQQIKVSPTTLRINTEIHGIPIDDLSFEVPVDAPLLCPLPFLFVNEADPHPIGWLTYNRGECFAHENLSLSIEGMVAAAAACLIGLPVGSGLTTEELKQTVGLQVVHLADPKFKPEALTSPIAQNLQQVLGWHDKKERQLMMLFGMDFALQRQGERVTAEEIAVLARGLEKLFGATYKQMERSFQHCHCNRQFFLAEEKKLIRPIDKKTFTLSLTSGLQVQEAQNNVGKMDNWVARMQTLAQLQTAGFTKIDIDTAGRTYAHWMKLDVSDKLLTPEEEADRLGVGQLIALIRQLGPQAPAILAQMLTQLTGGDANGATQPTIGGPPQQ